MNRTGLNIVLQVLVFSGLIFACSPPTYRPVAGISDPTGNMSVLIGTTYTFYGNDSYDRDSDGDPPQIRQYRWTIIPPTSSPYDETFPYSYIDITFDEVGTWTVELDVQDNDEPISYWSSTPDVRTVTVYELSDYPVVENVKVENVTSTNADVYGNLISVGPVGDTCKTEVYWGTTQAGETTSGWDDSRIFSDSQEAGGFGGALNPSSDFEKGAIHYFRMRARNSTGLVDWAPIEDPNCYRFVTPPGKARQREGGVWSFNDGSGLTAVDSVGGYDGTLKNMDGTDWVDGYEGDALEFDGVNDYVLTTYKETPAEYTVSLWFNLNHTIQTPATAEYEALVSRTGSASSDLWTIWFNTPAGEWPKLSLGNEKSNNNYAACSFQQEEFAADEWHHVAVVGTSTYARIYYDGELKNEVSDNFYIGAYDDGSPLAIGRPYSYKFRSDRYFNGKIDNVQVFGRVLSTEEIEAIYLDQLQLTSTSPVLQWISGDSDCPILHDVYFGTDPNAVESADHDSNEYIGGYRMPVYYPGELDLGTTYYWRVDEILSDPYNDNEERKTVGDVWSFRTMSIEVPDNLQAFAGDGSVSLTWSMEDDSDVAGFNVYRSGDGASFTRITDPNIAYAWYEDTTVVNGTTYYYKVAVVDGDGNESDYSEEVCAIPMAGLTAPIFVDSVGSGTPDGSIGMPYATIQTAINNASNGDVIVVCDGTYTGTGNRDIDFSGKIITLRSANGPENCVVDCGGSYYVPHRGFYFHTSEMNDSVLDGFTIQNGYASYGAGIYCDLTSPTIQNCVIRNCTASTGYTNFGGGGIYCIGLDSAMQSQPVVHGCIIEDNSSLNDGGGVMAVFAAVSVTDCVIRNNNARFNGGGFSTISSNSLLERCVIEYNEAERGGGFYVGGGVSINNSLFNNNAVQVYGGGGYINQGSSSIFVNDITNCTFVNNRFVNSLQYDRGSGLYIDGMSGTVENTIFWSNDSDNSKVIYLQNLYAGMGLSVDYCDIEDGIDSIFYNNPVHSEYLYWGDHNIGVNPLFADPNNDDYSLSVFSPCIDAGDNDVWEGVSDCNDIDGQPRKMLGWYVDDAGNGESPLVDIGADEWKLELNDGEIPYLTSFEEVSGFETGYWDDGDSSIDGWAVEDGSIYIDSTTYVPEWIDPNDTNDYIYQYLQIGSDDVLARQFDPNNAAEIIRINCIPVNGAVVSLQSKTGIVASLKFDADSVCVYEGPGQEDYIDTGIAYTDTVATCADFLNETESSLNNYGRPELYSYENCWMEFEIHINWSLQTYSVFWKHVDAPGGEAIAIAIPFDKRYSMFDEIELTTSSNYFLLNRISVSTEAEAGGILGEGRDIWIDLPIADKDHPLKGQVPVVGSMWYDQLGEYVIKACPVSEYSDPPATIVIDDEEVELDPWMTVVASDCTKRDNILGYWMTQVLQNGDYYLKLEVYDDLGRPICNKIMSKELEYNEGQFTKEVLTEYPVVGLVKGNTYHYEERPDITINWPGSFPFEFKRFYSDTLIKSLYPLFFGWTHNHNIRLTENCFTDWYVDEVGAPVADSSGLGIGKLWLQNALSCQMYMGYAVSPQVGEQARVKYVPQTMDHLELSQHKEYIIRTVTNVDETEPNAPIFTVQYVYYGADGRKMLFNENLTIQGSYEIPSSEGVVDWSVSKGIDRQEDRFGNALLYTWNNQLSGRDDEPEMYIMEIANNRTPAKLVFEDNSQPFGESGPKLYSKLKVLDSSNKSYEVIQYNNNVTTSWAHLGILWLYHSDLKVHYPTNYSVRDDYCRSTYSLEIDSGDINLTQFQPPQYFEGKETPDTLLQTSPTRDSTGALSEVIQSQIPILESDYRLMPRRLKKEYKYEYDEDGNLCTTIKYWSRAGDKSKWNDGYNIHFIDWHFKTETTKSSPEGAVIYREVKTYPILGFSGQYFDPYDYRDPGGDFDTDMMGVISRNAWSVGGGGNLRTEYDYSNKNFPTQPTAITEYFDDDGDNDYDRSRKTTIKYDDYGNQSELRNYISEGKYALTQYIYHEIFNFPTNQVTWQDYCHDDISGEPVTTGLERQEQQWIYGRDDGDIDNDPNNNIFLLKQKQLLDKTADTWSMAEYEYYPIIDNQDETLDGGQVKIKRVWVDSVNSRVDYYEYDENGFLSKEWNGTELDSNNQPTNNPQKRYLNNDRGLRLLEADYLGKVVMNIYDSIIDEDEEMYGDSSRLMEARNYEDLNAVTIDDQYFTVAHYEQYDWKSRMIFEEYTFYDTWKQCYLSTGGEIWQQFFVDGTTPHVKRFSTDDPYPSSELYTSLDLDGKTLYQAQYYSTSPSYYEHYPIYMYFMYDSMSNVVHNYAYEYGTNPTYGTFGLERFPNPYLMHTVYDYLSSGEKISETVYKVRRDGDDLFTQVLERRVGYEYDTLGRMTAQATWVVPDAIAPNNIVPGKSDPNCIVVKYGYDAVGNRIYVIDPNSNIVFTDYDNANRKTAEYFAVEPVFDNGSNDPNIMATYANAVMKRKVEYYLDGKSKSKTSYDYNGSVLAISEFDYDSRGRIAEVRQLINDNDSDEEISSGDDVAETAYTYSDDGLLAGPTRNSGSTTNGDYHIVISDAMNKQTGIRLSYHGKPEIVAYPSGDYEEYIYYDYDLYDGITPIPESKFNGLLEKKAVWKNSTKDYITYEYDDFGKVSKVIYPDDDLNADNDEDGQDANYDDVRIEYTYTRRNLGEYGKVETITDYRIDDDRPGAVGSAYSFKYNPWSESLMSYTDADGHLYQYDYNIAYNREQSIVVKKSSDEVIYSAHYDYDLAGRLTDVNDINTTSLAHFDYDLNGNRSTLIYHLDGDPNGVTCGIDYTYNIDNLLTGITTFDTDSTDGYDDAVYTFHAIGGIDGLGRLTGASEIITNPTQTSKSLSFEYDYDMMSQLVYSKAYNVGGHEYIAKTYSYAEDGNVQQVMRTIKNSGQDSYDLTTDFEYNGDLMKGASGDESFLLENDGNGNTTKLPTLDPNSIVFNWDNKLRSASKGNDSIAVKYDPMGNRVVKLSTVGGATTTRKYIVDISGKLSTILCEINMSDGSLEKSYIYADAQVLAQREHESDPNFYDESYYVHDQLGSVRMVVDYNDIDGYVFVANSYTYSPFGNAYADEPPLETVANPWQFAGQYHDAEINQYYLRARQYDPTMMRFTSRDPVRGGQNDPMTLHKYLYCFNDPANRVDPEGKLSLELNAIRAGYAVHTASIEMTALGTSEVIAGNMKGWDMINVGIGMAANTYKIMLIAAMEGYARDRIRDGISAIPFAGPIGAIAFDFTHGEYVGASSSEDYIDLAMHAAMHEAGVVFDENQMSEIRNNVGTWSEDLDHVFHWSERLLTVSHALHLIPGLKH